MSVRGKSVVHCHGKKKGKVIATLKSHTAAVKMHQAIKANQARMKALGG